MTEQISDDHWVCHDLDELKDKFCDWLDDQDHEPVLPKDTAVKSAEVDGKLHFKIHDVILSDPNDKGDEQDLYVTVERVESAGEWIVKDLIKFELSVLIEKNKPTNERKLTAEIEKLLSKNSQLKEINLIQFKKSK